MSIVIREQDMVDSVSDALQFMSYYHPIDYIQAVYAAYEVEESPAAKDAMAQILHNSRMCAEGHRPVCQDTGIVVAFVDVGMDVRWDSGRSLEEMIDEGVRRAYLHPDNKLRASIVDHPSSSRKNTRDNTPGVTHVKLVPGKEVRVRLAAKGGGSENKSKLAMLNPSDSIVDWVVETVPRMGAGWCPPGMLGIGIGGSAEKAAVLAKEALMDTIDIHEIRKAGPSNHIDALRLEIMDKVNALGIGAQGLGGLTTVLDVKIKEYPTHAASLPVAMIPNCAATRHAHFTLCGDGPVYQEAPALSKWPQVCWRASESATRVNLDALTRADIQKWRPGESLLLSGTLYTGRDAAHRRICNLIDEGKPLPNGLDLTGKLIYYVGPVDPVRDEVIGPAGPTTATRMDKFSDSILEHTGLLGMIGKAERGSTGIAAIKKHGAVYLMAVGGAAYLIAQAIKKSEVVAFEDLGMEAIYRFEVRDMPVTVAVDVNGDSVHRSGPEQWRRVIAERQVVEVR